MKKVRIEQESSMSRYEGKMLIFCTLQEMMMYESPLLQLTAMSVKPTPAKVLREKGFSKRLNQFRAVFERDDVAKEDIGGCSFETFVVDNHSYLPWLTKELQLMVST